MSADDVEGQAADVEPPTGWPPAPALDLARQLVAEWRAIGAAASKAERDDPGFGKHQAEIRGAGRQQTQAAELAAHFALVSIAEDIRRVADVLCKADAALGRKDGEP